MGLVGRARVRMRFCGLRGWIAPLLIAGAAALASCGDDSDGGGPAPAPTPTAVVSAAPWERTEEREACDDFDLLRKPYFGDLHVHTSVSADAYIFGTRERPRAAYRFALGEAIALADDDEQQTRSARIDRPLDFAAVTDHAEFFGEVQICSTPGSLVYDEEICELLRLADDPNNRFQTTVQWLFPAGIANPPPSLPFCETPGLDCDGAAVEVWQEIQAAAEEAYDRSAACTFTTFVGYEHTASPLGRHLHRNVIFRNHHVPAFAASQLETERGGTPQGVWTAIEDDCLHAGTGCDAVIIPHNPNLSGGLQWRDPADVDEAARRQTLEPLAELHQVKGNSECRFDRLAGRGLDTRDELCVFEQLRGAHQLPGTPPPSIDEYPRRNMIRNTLKDGLGFEETLGVNPFKLGFIGSTDTHNATAGATDETSWPGAGGNDDSSPSRQIGGIRDNPGGLAAVWAEENSRDALFDALRRRETYATSGTRPVLRFFGGDLTGVACGSADFVARAYETGTPMGGDIGFAGGAGGPRLAVLALKDPGTAENPGTDLQRVQIVKGWVSAGGEVQEKIFEVAGDPNNGAGVDPVTCAPVGAGSAELCAVWEDPEFDPTERAFYYARLLENPTCRWSTIVCKSVGVDPFSQDCAAQAAAAGEGFANCCRDETNDMFLSPTIQERAWSSPIWYRPEAIARIEGGIQFGRETGTDVLDLTVRIGPSPFDHPDAHDLTVKLSDDDEIYAVTIPAGTLGTAGDGSFALDDPSGAVGGLRSVTLDIEPNGGGGVLRLHTVGLDLSSAGRTDHMVRVSMEVGTYRTSHTRLWRLAGDRLGPVAH
jgi:hypothetical protein